MLGVARHQAGTHAADLATTAIDFEFRAPRQRQHQLVVVVGMFVRLVVQAGKAGSEHGRSTVRDWVAL